MDFEYNLNKSLSSLEEIYTPKFETDDIIFSDYGLMGNTINNGNNENQYNCEIHPNFKLLMVCVECTTLVCSCCVSLPIHSGHQHMEVDSNSITFKKIYYCMTKCKEKINNIMDIAISEYENIKSLIQDKEIPNTGISMNTQFDVFLDFIDLAIGNNNFNNI